MIEFFEIFTTLIDYMSDKLLYAVLISAGVYLIAYVFRAVGLFTLAKRAENRRAWFAFVPLLNSYLLGELAGDCVFATLKIKRIGLWYCLAEGAACVAYLLSDIATTTLYRNGANYNYDVGSWQNVSGNLLWAQNMDAILSYVLLFLELVYLFFFVLAVITFFRKYAARNALLFSIASVFVPVVGSVLVFAVRNNTPVNYEQYVRAKREAYYHQTHQNYQNGETQDPYRSRNDSAGTQPSYEGDVFEEFSDSRNGQTNRSENDEFFG